MKNSNQMNGGNDMIFKSKNCHVLPVVILFSMFLYACSAENASESVENNTANYNSEETSGQNEGTAVIGMIGEPSILNPLFSGDSASMDIHNLIFDGLVTFDPEMEVEPAIAKEWEISEDGLTYTFTLHEGVLFHDGEELTADDVVFTYEIFIHEDYTGPRANEFVYIEEITALDDYTVEFTLSDVDARFLTAVHYGILPEHELGDVPVADVESHEFTRQPLGNGPYQFDDWEDGGYVQLVAFEDYYQGTPNIDRLVFNIVPDQNALMSQFEAGEIDFMDVPPVQIDSLDQWVDNGIAEKHTTLNYGYSYLGYNNQMDMFSDKETRQALSHALNREEMVEAILQGEGEVAHAPMSPLSWAYPDDVAEFNYDPDRARELLAEAGWTEGSDGILERDGERFSFQLLTNQGNQIREDLVVIIQSQLNDIGVEAVPELREWSSFIETADADFEAFILGWGLPTDPDPTRYWHSLYTEDGLGGNNNVLYEREDLDELIEQNVHIVDQEERKELLQYIFSEIVEDQPNTFLFYDNAVVATSPRLKGFEQHAGDKFYSILDWHLED